MTKIFEVQPLVGPLPIKFGMSEEEIQGLLGKPQARNVNRRDEPVLDYGICSVTFGAGGEGVVQVAFFPEAELILSGMNLFTDPTAFAKVLSVTPDVFEDYGFIVLPSIGLTFTGFHDDNEEDKAITLFVRGRWDERRSKFRPFKL